MNLEHDIERLFNQDSFNIMKTNRCKILLPVVLFFTGHLLVKAQGGSYEVSDLVIEEFGVVDEYQSYEDLTAQGLSDQVKFKRLGNFNYVRADYENAAKWYGQLIEAKDAKIESEYYYRFAQSLKSLGDYANADKWMDKYNAASEKDSRAKKYRSNKNYLSRIKRNSGRYKLKTLNINSSFSDFAPSIRGEELVFSTARDTGLFSRNTQGWNNGSFLDFNSVKIQNGEAVGEPEKFAKNLNTKANESTSIFTKDGQTMYFTRNNSKSGKFKRDKKGVSRLKIYRAQYKEGVWQKPKELPFNSDDYSVAHPALSDDGKTLYFSSDMPGSIGDSDIFKVEIHADGTFGEPVNLGEAVNTEGRETFPFFAEGILYFSSDGHPGLGGLDIFATKLDVPRPQILNVGKPVNGKRDDFSYIINPKGEGYFASNRKGGAGGDDIYGFLQTKPLQFDCYESIQGTVTESESNMPLGEAKVILMKGSTIVAETTSAADGKFDLEIDCNRTRYKLVINKEGYLTTSEDWMVDVTEEAFIKMVKEMPEDGLISDTNSNTEESEPSTGVAGLSYGDNLLTALGLSSIYFDFDSAQLTTEAKESLKSVIQYISEHPELNILVQSHTDAIGPKGYNQLLSERRAKATFNFLVQNGVNPTRLRKEGRGETKLVNACEDGTVCSARQNRMNRRSELLVAQ